MTEINEAITSAGNNGHVFFPNGNYEVAGLTASFVGQTWEFARDAKLKKANGNTAAMIALAASGLKILGGDFDCNRSGAPAATVFVDGTDKDFKMVGATVHGGSSWGVAIDNGLVLLRDCRFYNMAFAALIWRATTRDGEGNLRFGPIIENCMIDRRVGYVSAAGLQMRAVGAAGYFQGAMARGNIILMPATGEATSDNVALEMTEAVNSSMVDNIVTGSRIAYSLGKAIRCSATGNRANAVGNYGIEIAQGCEDCVVSGNVVSGLSLTTPGIGGCVITGASKGNVVVGNRLGREFPVPVYQDSSSASASPANLIANNL
ncbi:hypothetical protein HFO41_10915 [Rhizobium leguminosarum]|uniref:right-handed parallel beta-helix repeat-containing protein n=1 Tax=Rhizobium leguminosarum TaxID=384 RepID=UPI001C945B92|nr:right-handed parallel beta-helix repeat-containing protein [Rhizobium leguminosarum]MBY5689334.1 hypothetical protein [Rhizobium leguminosarum]